MVPQRAGTRFSTPRAGLSSQPKTPAQHLARARPGTPKNKPRLQLGQAFTWCLCSFTIVLVSLYTLGAALSPQNLPDSNKRPWIIAHRGASGTLPEHTREAYLLAIQQGADFIECDVTLTSDCNLVCRHEPLLSGTTNADELFHDRATTYDIDQQKYEGVFATDLTLADIKRLRARQSMPYRSQDFNGLYSIPTLQEYIDIALSANRSVGIYPEVKHPSWHDSRQLSCMHNTTITEKVLQVLHSNGYSHPMGSPEWLRQPAFIQSFEVGNLQWLASHTQLPLIQLLDPAEKIVPDTQQTYGSLMSEQGLAGISQYAAGIGPHKRDIIGAVHPGMPGWRLIQRAHAHGLAVHPFTFRDDAVNVDARWKGEPLQEASHFIDLHVDGAFTDFPATWHTAVQSAQGPQAVQHLRRERPLESLQEM